MVKILKILIQILNNLNKLILSMINLQIHKINFILPLNLIFNILKVLNFKMKMVNLMNN